MVVPSPSQDWNELEGGTAHNGGLDSHVELGGVLFSVPLEWRTLYAFFVCFVFFVE